jgi:flagellar protein FliO/FliZ
MIRPKLLAACAVPVGLALLHGAPAFAADRGESTPLDLQPVQQEATSSGGGLVRTFVGLAVVLAVIYGVYWVLRQVKAGRELATGGRGLSTVASLPLGPGRAVHLVRAGHEVLLVGSAEQGVAALRVYGEQEARDAGLLADDEDGDEPPARPPSAGAFLARALRDLIARIQRRTVRG